MLYVKLKKILLAFAQIKKKVEIRKTYVLLYY